MSHEILKIQSVAHLHELFGFDKPLHSLISLIDTAQLEISKEWLNLKVTSNLYFISLKDASCAMNYGLNQYDFNNGVLIFTGPGQVYSVSKEQKLNEIKGWMLYFHPDLIKNTSLAKSIDDFSFFSYDVHEALYLTRMEENSITDCVSIIQEELTGHSDHHSQKVIVFALEMLLEFCSRYYERQFGARSAKDSDILSQMEILLKDYYESGLLPVHGIPAVSYFAEKMHRSSNYLSDILKKETGRSALEHINDFIIEKAKKILLASTDSVSEIAYSLGFNYPHYFSRLFKAKTGMSPIQYRDTQLKLA